MTDPEALQLIAESINELRDSLTFLFASVVGVIIAHGLISK